MKQVSENVEPKFYARSDVFAAAAAAQRINGEYVKRTKLQFNRISPANSTLLKNDPNTTKLPNGSLMKIMLAANCSDITPQDYEYGERVREYFCSKITLIFDGTAQSFIKAAVDAATIEEVPEAGPMIMLVASLPSVYERNIQRSVEREKLSEATNNSIPLDQQIGETVQLNITVIDAIYKPRFNSTAVNAVVNNIQGNRVIFFFDRKNWVKGNTYNIAARIKNKGNQITQVHYVYQLTPDGKEKEI